MVIVEYTGLIWILGELSMSGVICFSQSVSALSLQLFKKPIQVGKPFSNEKHESKNQCL